MNLPRIEQAEVRGKRVLVRVDYNVPYDENWEVADATRIVESLPTIQYLLERKAKVILMSHRGGAEAFRVRGDKFYRERTKISHRRFKYWSEKSVMEYVGKKLQELIQLPVVTLEDCIGEEVQRVVGAMREGEIVLLENLRFYGEEEENDEGFARELAQLAEIYVNDAFSASHRPHASLIGVPRFLPHYAGFSMLKELQALEKLLMGEERPFCLLMGGAKISDKIAVMENLLDKVDSICIGGALSYTFFKAQGWEVGKSKVEAERIETCQRLLEKAKEQKLSFFLPEDVVAATKFSPDASSEVVAAQAIPANQMAMDIGPKTGALYSKILKESRRLFWNGPMGVFEMPNFAQGTLAILGALKDYQGYAVIGGGESAQAARRYGVDNEALYIATGGGASLQFLSGKPLPGIEALLQ